jgi:putative peptidoglycan lipid II flippase
MLVKILAPGFYSRQDTKTPVRIGIIAVIANILLNLAIVLPWYLSGVIAPHAGLALATALAGYVNAGLLYIYLRKKGIYEVQKGTGLTVLRVLLAGICMGAVLYFVNPVAPTWYGWSAPERALSLFGLISLGAITYFVMLLLLGLRPAQFRQSA